MTQIEQEKAAKEISIQFKGDIKEHQDCQNFWNSILSKIFGVNDTYNFIQYEKEVKIDNTKHIDAYIDKTKVIIEQKSSSINLNKAYVQSDNVYLTPYEQAKRYADELGYEEKPKWIVVSNFKEIHIHDMNFPRQEPEIIKLENLEKEYNRLSFLVDENNVHVKKEMELSMKAGDIVGKIYEALLKQYKNPEDENTLKSLNILCVRLVFCLYAEDAGIFDKKSMFHDYLEKYEPEDIGEQLEKLFKVLDTKEENRKENLSPALAAFPYVNGGLFNDENIIIPLFTKELKDLLLEKASDDFNWSEISPTIFGAVFESTLNPETRRKGGMHYTSIENIHKVIDPLFLNDLYSELDKIKEMKRTADQKAALHSFQDKLASLTFLDPACGSGNFLTESYLSIRSLENQVITLLNKDNRVFAFDDVIKVNINQFYGIEINDFAVVVAKTALWIAESQMFKKTEQLLDTEINFLPLKSNASIHEANALRIDWNDVISKDKLNYIIGNPPFVGYSLQSKEQKKDLLSIYTNNDGILYPGAGKIDYVSAWFMKAAIFILHTKIQCSFVATNSITQGEQISFIWKPLIQEFDIKINFAYKTFRWDSEASDKAHVHCVIIGFSYIPISKNKVIFLNKGESIIAKNINPYLLDGDNIFIESRTKPIMQVPQIRSGGKPVEGGHFIFSEAEKEIFVKKEPASEKYFRKFIGGDEFIQGKNKWCLWLLNISPSELKSLPLVKERVKLVKEFREASIKPETRKYANYPTRFMEIKQPSSDYLLIPATSSENRKYIPIGFIPKEFIASNAASFIPDATTYDFGILSSSVHNAWMRIVCGRLEMRYRYSNKIVYNNFPWCTPTNNQREKIQKTAKKILEVRAVYQNCSLEELYDNLTMPPDLLKAHEANDKAVMEAYGFNKDLSESEIVAELFKMYKKLTAKE